jgi:hypothetical protein
MELLCARGTRLKLTTLLPALARKAILSWKEVGFREVFRWTAAAAAAAARTLPV